MIGYIDNTFLFLSSYAILYHKWNYNERREDIPGRGQDVTEGENLLS